jgi:hypothetical protein
MPVVCPRSRASLVFVFSRGQVSFGFSIEEELKCGVQSCSENFVFRNENTFTFQLTADIGFWKEGGGFEQIVNTHPGQMM